ncbi:MAG: hypothetical protein JXR63_07365 [Spirochaetales bacterium]|nr:hypothetical protein [Spirochaetales bacterium]
MKERLQNIIKKSQNLLEEVYVELGTNYGNVTKTVEDCLKESKSLVEQFKQRISTGENNILHSVKEIENNVGDVVEGFWTIEQDLDNLVQVFSQSFVVVEDIEKNISKIKDSSELMEVVALNAMVVAIKSGKNGGGFTFVSESLKNNATATIKLTDDVLGRGEMVRDEFESLQEILKGLIVKSKNLNELIEKNITGRFYELYQMIEEFVDFLENLYADAVAIRKPVYAIMQNLQYQDILRQSVEHVDMFLQHFFEPKDFVNDDNLLDFLATKEFICDFSLIVFNEAKMQVQTNVHDFNEALGDIDARIENLNSKGDAYLKTHKSVTASGVSSLIQSFSDSLKVLLEEIKKTDNIKEIIESKEQNLFRNMKLLQEKNNEFFGLIKVFRNIIVLGRIEISKHEALKDVDNSIDNIEAVTDIVESAVKEISECYEQITFTDTKVRDQLEKLFLENSLFVEKLNKDIGILYEYMSQVRSMLFNSLGGFEDLEHKIVANVDKSKSDMNSLDKYLATIEDGITLCSVEKSLAYKQKKDILNSRGLSEWIVHNEEMHKLIEKFTVYRHREQAKFLSGIDHSGSSVAEGSVSLF